MIPRLASGLAVLLLLVATSAEAQKTAPINKAKLLGSWLVTTSGITAVEGDTWTFTKDKVTILGKRGKKTATTTGTYSVTGNKLKITVGAAGITGDIDAQITSLTDNELVLETLLGGAPSTLKRKTK